MGYCWPRVGFKNLLFPRRFRSLIPSYIRDSSIAIIVYDISNVTTFENVRKWYQDVKHQRDDVLIMIVGNKSDLEENRYEKERWCHA